MQNLMKKTDKKIMTRAKCPGCNHKKMWWSHGQYRCPVCLRSYDVSLIGPPEDHIPKDKNKEGKATLFRQ